MKLLPLLTAAAALLLSGCNTVTRAVQVVTQPVAGALNAVTGPVRGMTN